MLLTYEQHRHDILLTDKQYKCDRHDILLTYEQYRHDIFIPCKRYRHDILVTYEQCRHDIIIANYQYIIKVITTLPNSEQYYKGRVQTHNYINRQNQSTTGKL
jgi:hypothetical protein